MIKYKSTYNSFSLIEMSIVLVIVALMTTFVITSTNLSSVSKINSIMSDVRYYAKQTERFVELYGGLPGDLANVSILPNNSTAQAGNGNGKIDTPAEALQYWVHLQLAGLIAGNYNSSATSAYDPNTPNAAGGFPLGNYPQSIITVESNSSYGLTYVFSQKSSSNYTLGFLTPADASNLDKKYDDGNPDTGIIRAFNAACKTTNTYTLSNTSTSCYLKINVENKSSTASSGNYSTCSDGANFGSSRISIFESCPLGYNGVVIEHCTNSGWTQLRKNCEPVSCGHGLTYGQTMTMQCAPGYNNAGSITYVCGQYGILYPSAVTCGANTSEPCTSSGLIRTFACPVGYRGTWQQTCNGSTWTSNTFSTGCLALQCGSIALGSETSFSASCGAWNAIGTSVGVCSLPITPSSSAPATTGSASLAKAYCTPNYNSCTGSSSIDIACPAGQTGIFTKRCNGSYYEMVSSTCVPSNCGGEPVGTWRVAQEQSCGTNSSGNSTMGVVLEICTYTDSSYTTASWQTSYAACN